MSDLNVEEGKPKPVENLNPTIRLSKSLYELVSKSPGGAISSIAALFVVIVLSILIPLLFPTQSS